MSIPTFTQSETNLMVIYNTGTRLGLLNELGEMMNYIAYDERKLRDLTLSVIRKLEQMTDEDFAALDLAFDARKEW